MQLVVSAASQARQCSLVQVKVVKTGASGALELLGDGRLESSVDGGRVHLRASGQLALYLGVLDHDAPQYLQDLQ